MTPEDPPIQPPTPKLSNPPEAPKKPATNQPQPPSGIDYSPQTSGGGSQGITRESRFNLSTVSNPSDAS